MNKIKKLGIAFDIAFIYLLINTFLYVTDAYIYDFIVGSDGLYASLYGIKSSWFISSIILIITFGCFSYSLRKDQNNNTNKHLIPGIVGFLLVIEGILNISKDLGQFFTIKYYLENKDVIIRLTVSMIKYTIQVAIGLVFLVIGMRKEVKSHSKN